MDTSEPTREPSRSEVALAGQRRLEAALAAANDLASLKALEGEAAAVETYARHLDLALVEQNRIAEMRIRIARKLGMLLQQTVQRGGRSNLQHESSIRGGSSAPLPPGISHTQSHRYQELARIPDEHLERYLADCESSRRPVSAASLVRASRRWRDAGAGPHRPRRQVTLDRSQLSAVWEAVLRVMVVDVAIDIPAEAVHAGAAVSAQAPSPLGLHGRVAGVVERGIDRWLGLLADRSRVEEAIVVLPADTTAAWFQRLAGEPWSCCFLRGRGRSTPAVAYHGERKQAFWLSFRDLGCVWEAAIY